MLSISQGCGDFQAILTSIPIRSRTRILQCKGGREIAPARHSREDFIHKSWSHKELRDDFNTAEKIRADERFQKFLRWLYEHESETVFKTGRNRSSTDRKYR